MSGPGSDLDAGLDAGLETHPAWAIILLAAAPGVASSPSTAANWLLLIPVTWTIWRVFTTRRTA